jgi:hypothetical protein
MTSWVSIYCLDCWLDDQGISIQFLRGVRDFPANCADQLWGPTGLLFSGYWGVKWSSCEGNQPPSGVKMNNGWSSNSTPHLSSSYSQEHFIFRYTKSFSCSELVFRRCLIQILAGCLVILTQVFMMFLNCTRLMLDICLTKADLGCVKTCEQKSCVRDGTPGAWISHEAAND